MSHRFTVALLAYDHKKEDLADFVLEHRSAFLALIYFLQTSPNRGAITARSWGIVRPMPRIEDEALAEVVPLLSGAQGSNAPAR